MEMEMENCCTSYSENTPVYDSKGKQILSWTHNEKIKIKIGNIFGESKVIEGVITEVEDDCIHIKTDDNTDYCIDISNM